MTHKLIRKKPIQKGGEAGQGLVEYIIGISIFLLLAAPVLYQIFVALAQKLTNVSAQIVP